MDRREGGLTHEKRSKGSREGGTCRREDKLHDVIYIVHFNHLTN